MSGFSQGGDGEQEGKKTRVIVRADIGDNTIPIPNPPYGADPGQSSDGTVIGRTRLVGGGDPGAGPAVGGLQTVKMSPSPAKTEFMRVEDVDTTEPVAAWVVVVKGPGRGSFRSVYMGMNSVGRGSDQRVKLDFGDDSISREAHAYITYDEKARVYYLQHGGKSNLVRLHNQPVLMPMELKLNDHISIGKTILRFVPLCGPDFDWSDEVAEA